MLWLYFLRDYYRATPEAARAKPTQNHCVLSSSIATSVVKPRAQPSVRMPIPEQPAAEQGIIESSSDCLQRLSIMGDQAFALWDHVAGFSIFSGNFDRITGLRTGQCAGHDWIHHLHHDQQFAVNEALMRACEGTAGRCLVQAKSEDGTWRWLLLEMKAPHQKQPSVMVLWRDLSEQKALEEALKELESSLAMSEQGRSAFLSSMSHELRTPLNAIMGFSEMMKSGIFGNLDNPTYQQYAEHIHSSGATLLQKVNDLLDIASMNNGGFALDESAVMLTDLLDEAISIHSHQSFTRNQCIRIDCPHPVKIKVDRAKLICAVSHVLANALRHSPEKSEILLTVRGDSEEGLIISVRDNGEGVPPVQLQLIREALNAKEAYFNIESGGIGLGLSLSKELLASHGGRILIDSIRYRGTVVSLILPPQRVISGLAQKRRSRHLSVVAD